MHVDAHGARFRQHVMVGGVALDALEKRHGDTATGGAVDTSKSQ
jgi:hypothetical protein